MSVRELRAVNKKSWWERPLGIAAIGVVVTVVGGLIVWLISRHYDKPSSSTTIEAPKAQSHEAIPPSLKPDKPSGQQSSASGKQANETAKQRKTPKTRKVPIDASSGDGSPAVGSITQGAGSALSINQQGGITATQVNIDTHAHLILADDQKTAVTQAMKSFAGRHVLILANGSTTEQVVFGKGMQAALHDAGINAEFSVGVALPEGGEASPWLFVGWGEHNADMAKALVEVICNTRIVPAPHVGVHYYPNGDKDGFQFIIGKPD